MTSLQKLAVEVRSAIYAAVPDLVAVEGDLLAFTRHDNSWWGDHRQACVHAAMQVHNALAARIEGDPRLAAAYLAQVEENVVWWVWAYRQTGREVNWDGLLSRIPTAWLADAEKYAEEGGSQQERDALEWRVEHRYHPGFSCQAWNVSLTERGLAEKYLYSGILLPASV